MFYLHCYSLKVFIIAHSQDTNSLMYRTTDGGATDFEEIHLPFIFFEEFVFHPDSRHSKKILARSTEKVRFAQLVYFCR